MNPSPQSARAIRRRITHQVRKIPDLDLRAAVACAMAVTELSSEHDVQPIAVARIVELTGLSLQEVQKAGQRLASVGLIGIQKQRATPLMEASV